MPLVSASTPTARMMMRMETTLVQGSTFEGCCYQVDVRRTRGAESLLGDGSFAPAKNLPHDRQDMGQLQLDACSGMLSVLPRGFDKERSRRKAEQSLWNCSTPPAPRCCTSPHLESEARSPTRGL